MTTFTGFVAKMFEKSGSSKGRAWTAYSFKLQDPSSGQELPQYFQLGFSNPGVKEGDYIRFDATQKDAKAFTVDHASVKHGKNPPARPADPDAGKRQGEGNRGGRNGNGGGGYQKDPETQARITMQHSQEMAILAVQALLANDGLPMSAAKTKGGQAKRFEEIVAQIDKFTVKFYHDANTPARLLDTVADWSLTDVAANGELPADADEEPEQASFDDVPEEVGFDDNDGFDGDDDDF